eukprot:TRINITY_DN402_c0_g1_i1.p1 TRINITY_DN402_c0_g1~~TRINITY_DN402_c0_g1_i1.p1  ORF type:complete len:165 (-),score=44.13 TRINITY_DN402_c0_g1_i1:111-605(-)
MPRVHKRQKKHKQERRGQGRTIQTVMKMKMKMEAVVSTQSTGEKRKGKGAAASEELQVDIKGGYEGHETVGKSTITLTELGPRLELQLLVVHDALWDGTLLYSLHAESAQEAEEAQTGEKRARTDDSDGDEDEDEDDSGGDGDADGDGYDERIRRPSRKAVRVG